MIELKGILPAIHTSYDAEGEVTTAGLEGLLGHYVEAGCSGVFVGGSTGEGVLQTVEERARFTEAVCKTLAGQAIVVAHVGAASTRDACELARRAKAAGADAIGSVMPFYFRYSAQDCAAYYRSLAEAGDLPLLIYYLASAGGITLTAQSFVETFADLPNVFALKYTSTELETLGRIVELCGDRLVCALGADQMLLPGLVLGAPAAIGTTYNFMPEIAVGVWRHYEQGDLGAARALYLRAFRLMFAIMQRMPLLAASREILRMRGHETGRCRGPLPDLTSDQRAELCRILEEQDFFTDPIRD